LTRSPPFFIIQSILRLKRKKEEMLTISQVTLFTAASLVLIFTPGPDIVYVMTRGMAQGRRAALAAAAGFALGNFVHTFFVVVGLSALLMASPTAFQIVKWAGAAYLIYLGIKMIRSASGVSDAQSGPSLNGWAVFRQSIIANVLNPKVALFFLAFFPQFINRAQGHPQIQMILLGTLFVLLTLICFGLVGFFSGSLGQWLQRNKAFENRMIKIAGAIFILLGLSLAWPH
jgi:threonine/homoserine/homoserine lactone efflux protein